MALAAIALGSNLPGLKATPEANLEGALESLARLGTVVARSQWYRTAPVGYSAQPYFLNGAALLETELSPRELLVGLLRIEQQFGRDRSHGVAKGPRTLDLDLLLYDGLVLREPDLVVPHPAMHERRFVLEPLAEIAPALLHPALQKSVRELLCSVS